MNEYPLAPWPVQTAKNEVNHSVVEISKPRDQSPPSEENTNQIAAKEYYSYSNTCVSVTSVLNQ
jgi:hypothetical protein